MKTVMVGKQQYLELESDDIYGVAMLSLRLRREDGTPDYAAALNHLIASHHVVNEHNAPIVEARRAAFDEAFPDTSEVDDHFPPEAET